MKYTPKVRQKTFGVYFNIYAVDFEIMFLT